MTDECRDPIGEEANRRAHKVARAARFCKGKFESLDAWPSERSEALDALFRAVESYEEIEKRAEAEATL